MTIQDMGAGIAHWLERRTQDLKIPGSKLLERREKIFLSVVNFLC